MLLPDCRFTMDAGFRNSIPYVHLPAFTIPVLIVYISVMSVKSFPMLPIDRIESIEGALVHSFGSAEVSDVALLAGGLSGSAIYKLRIGDNAYTLKLTPPQEGEMTDVPGLAAAAGVAPRMYFNDQRQGVSISDFINNQPLRGVFSPDELVRKLATTIRAIHALPSVAEGRPLFTTVDALISQFNNSGILSGPVVDACLEGYQRLKENYTLRKEDEVCSHNDLNPNNILCDGSTIWIIDWDTASLNNRYIDLANAANFFVHTPEHERAYLHTYFEAEPDENQVSRFFVMRQLCRIIYSMLMFQLAAHMKPAGFRHDQRMEGFDMPTFGSLMASGSLSLAEYEGLLFYGKALLNTAADQMRLPRFEKALAQLR